MNCFMSDSESVSKNKEILRSNWNFKNGQCKIKDFFLHDGSSENYNTKYKAI